jgi:hypothetical protein
MRNSPATLFLSSSRKFGDLHLLSSPVLPHWQDTFVKNDEDKGRRGVWKLQVVRFSPRARAVARGREWLVVGHVAGPSEEAAWRYRREAGSRPPEFMSTLVGIQNASVPSLRMPQKDSSPEAHRGGHCPGHPNCVRAGQAPVVVISGRGDWRREPRSTMCSLSTAEHGRHGRLVLRERAAKRRATRWDLLRPGAARAPIHHNQLLAHRCANAVDSAGHALNWKGAAAGV